MMTIRNVAEIIGGQIMTRVTSEDASDGKPAVMLTTKAVEDGVIDRADLKDVVLVRPVDDEKYTRIGDVMLKLSTPYDAAYVDEGYDGLVFPSFFVVIRVSDRVDAQYLTALLNSRYVRRQLQLIQTGVGRPMVRISDIRELQIPEIPLEKMRELGQEYAASCQKRKLLREMEKTERELMEGRLLESTREA